MISHIEVRPIIRTEIMCMYVRLMAHLDGIRDMKRYYIMMKKSTNVNFMVEK